MEVRPRPVHQGQHSQREGSPPPPPPPQQLHLQSEQQSSNDRRKVSPQDDEWPKRPKYGSRPPEFPKSTDAQVSQWILAAEREDRRLAEMKFREETKELQLQQQSSRSAADDKSISLRRHRGCEFRLPSSSPIPIPKVKYDPLDKVWLHQEQRRRRCQLQKKRVAPKKDAKALMALADAGFEVKLTDDPDDSDDNENSDQEYIQGIKPCPVCSFEAERKAEQQQQIEIAVDVTPRGDDTAATIIATATSTIVVCTKPDEKDEKDGAVANATNQMKNKLSHLMRFGFKSASGRGV